MALVISLKPGEDFYVGEERFVVTEVFSETHFRVLRESTGQLHEITADRKSEILKDVFVTGGKRRKPIRIKVVALRETRVRPGG